MEEFGGYFGVKYLGDIDSREDDLKLKELELQRANLNIYKTFLEDMDKKIKSIKQYLASLKEKETEYPYLVNKLIADYKILSEWRKKLIDDIEKYFSKDTVDPEDSLRIKTAIEELHEIQDKLIKNIIDYHFSKKSQTVR